MRGDELLEKMALIDPAYLESADEKPKKKTSVWIRWGAMAACLCIAAVGALTIPKLRPEVQPALPAVQEAAVQPTSAASQETEVQPTPSVSQDKAEAPAYDAVPIINGSDYPDSEACYPVPEPGTTLFFEEVNAAMNDWRGSEAKLFLGIDINDAQWEILKNDSDAMATETRRLATLGYEIGWYEAWTYQGKGEQVPYTFLYGLFTVEELENFAASPDYGYSFFFANNGDGTCVEYTGRGTIIEGEELRYEDTPMAPTVLNEAEAYAANGAYLPESLPDGFAFESAYENQGAISVTWTSGYCSLTWNVSNMTEDDAKRQTPAANTENYDLSLYPIPRADSVPEYRREVVNDPVFLIEELTQEVVNMRAEYSDEPDDEGYRMRFGVHYSQSGVLVEIDAKGVDPAWMFKQLQLCGE